jgi:hypothetical protein
VILAGRRLAPYGSKDFRKVLPGNSYRLEIRIDEWLDMKEAGKYSFRVAYWNRYSGSWLGQAVWTGVTPKSRAVLVDIVE